MNTKVPSLTMLRDGRYVTRWGGRRHYFGRDEGAAFAQYKRALDKWRRWRERRNEARQVITASTDPDGRLGVVTAADQFLVAKRLERGRNLERYYRKHLKRFLYATAHEVVADISARHLNALKLDMLQGGFAPKTINHDLIAARAFLRWCYDFLEIPAKPLRSIRTIPLGEPPDRSMTIAEVRTMINKAPYPIKPWLVVNYLTAGRPIEVVRLVNDAGRWAYPGIYRIENKVGQVTGEPRHLIVSPLAQRWLECCEPVWTRLDSYSAAVRRKEACGPGGPHRLRHSAATHLLQAGVARADVDQILGHLPRRVSRTYGRMEWQRLVSIAACLGFRHPRRTGSKKPRE